MDEIESTTKACSLRSENYLARVYPVSNVSNDVQIPNGAKNCMDRYIRVQLAARSLLHLLGAQ